MEFQQHKARFSVDNLSKTQILSSDADTCFLFYSCHIASQTLDDSIIRSSSKNLWYYVARPRLFDTVFGCDLSQWEKRVQLACNRLYWRHELSATTFEKELVEAAQIEEDLKKKNEATKLAEQTSLKKKLGKRQSKVNKNNTGGKPRAITLCSADLRNLPLEEGSDDEERFLSQPSDYSQYVVDKQSQFDRDFETVQLPTPSGTGEESDSDSSYHSDSDSLDSFSGSDGGSVYESESDVEQGESGSERLPLGGILPFDQYGQEITRNNKYESPLEIPENPFTPPQNNTQSHTQQPPQHSSPSPPPRPPKFPTLDLPPITNKSRAGSVRRST